MDFIDYNKREGSPLNDSPPSSPRPPLPPPPPPPTPPTPYMLSLPSSVSINGNEWGSNTNVGIQPPKNYEKVPKSIVNYDNDYGQFVELGGGKRFRKSRKARKSKKSRKTRKIRKTRKSRNFKKSKKSRKSRGGLPYPPHVKVPELPADAFFSRSPSPSQLAEQEIMDNWLQENQHLGDIDGITEPAAQITPPLNSNHLMARTPSNELYQFVERIPETGRAIQDTNVITPPRTPYERIPGSPYTSPPSSPLQNYEGGRKSRKYKKSKKSKKSRKYRK